MYALTKLQQYGVKWVIRRLVREFIKPTTSLGQYFRPMSSLLYHAISKPINFMYARVMFKDTANDTLYFFYDFEIEPITYDFIWALCVANARREELGLRFMHVVLVPGSYNGLRRELPDYDKVLTHDTRVWRIYSILFPSIRLLPCPCSVTLCASREEAAYIREQKLNYQYPSRYNVTFPIAYDPELAVGYQQSCMALRADNQAKAYVLAWLEPRAQTKKTIVITLRQYAFTPERNSNLSAWATFAKMLDREQFYVVFVPDTEQGMQPIPPELSEFDFFQAACWNLNLRAALYELAYLNLGVNTGPMTLCWFNPRCRYITFKVAVKNVPHVPLTMITDKGFIPGQNPAFANAFQKWVWEDDHAEVLVREFASMCQVIA